MSVRTWTVNTMRLGLLLAIAGCAAAPLRSMLPGRFVACSPSTRASLRALAACDGTVAWVGGTGGTLLRTEDGGHNWRDVAPPDSAACDFRDLAVFDRDTAVVMVAGQPARVYRTTDGGRSWRIVLEDARPAAFFDAVDFAGDCGVLFGDAIDGAFCAWVSDDRGASWKVVPSTNLPTPIDGEAAFAASGTCLGALPEQRAWVATGSGPTRFLTFAASRAAATAVDLPLAHGSASRGAFSIAFRGSRGVAVGGDYEDPQGTAGSAAWTDDGGASWHGVRSGAGGYRSAVCWLGDGELLAVGSSGASWSQDSGRSWVNFDAAFHTLAVGHDGSVWAAGSDGRVARWVATER